MFLKPNDLDWMDATSHIFLNPRFSTDVLDTIINVFQKINEKGHVFLATSGSTAQINTYKLVALHKNAFLASSQAVNAMFDIDDKDVLLNILPVFHVGGLSLFSRAFCANAEMVNVWNENFKWNPNEFVNICNNKNVTVTSLVPTQIHDLVVQNLKSPSSVRCVFVGGGALANALFLKAKELGWNLYPTYGMTECCSQVATTRVSSTTESALFSLQVLPHLNVILNEDSRIVISGHSLLSYYVHISDNHFNIQDPKINNAFETQDIGRFENGYLHVLGRVDDNVKINGEFTNLIHLNHVFNMCQTEQKMNLECTIISLEDARKGIKIVAVFLCCDENKKEKIEELIKHFNTRVMPYERVATFAFVDEIPKTALGKIKTSVLKDHLKLIHY